MIRRYMKQLHRFVVQAYCRLYWVSSIRCGIRMKGLGVALRSLPQDFCFHALGRTFHFTRDCAAAFGTLPGGRSNEPETIRFLDAVLSKPDSPVSLFIDIGASIGEMAIFAAGLPKVARVFAVEPQPACCQSIQLSAVANNFTNVEVIEGAVSDVAGEGHMICSSKSPTSTHLTGHRVHEGQIVRVFPLDTLGLSLADFEGAVLLIDVEGEELNVVKGAANFILHSKPLIIFEYNDTTRKAFELQEMRLQLGSGYDLYRLRGNGDGRLDRNFLCTWNLVAIPFGSIWESLCAPLKI